MIDSTFLSRREAFGSVGSTNDVIRGWLAGGLAEVCVAVADEQLAGRGREDRRWVAPSGTSALISLGFRPTWLDPQLVWRLGATVSLAMADAAEDVAGLPDRTVRLKWPNDLVISAHRSGSAERAGQEDPGPRKLGGVLGETAGLGGREPTAIVGIGVNVDWAAADFPPELVPTMTSLREAAGGRPVDRDRLLEAFLDRLEARIEALRGGRFDVADWTARQLGGGRLARVVGAGDGSTIVRVVGVDARSGGLVVEDPERPGAERTIHAGEITHLRVLEA